MSTCHSQVICTDCVLLTTDVVSVQTVETVPVVSEKASEELIRRVQTPSSLGDSSWLRVQLGRISTVNFSPTGISFALPR